MLGEGSAGGGVVLGGGVGWGRCRARGRGRPWGRGRGSTLHVGTCPPTLLRAEERSAWAEPFP